MPVRNFIGFGATGAEGRNAHGIHTSGFSHVIDQNVIGNNDIGILRVPAAENISITNNRIGLLSRSRTGRQYGDDLAFGTTWR
jgi:hypothetical protein